MFRPTHGHSCQGFWDIYGDFLKLGGTLFRGPYNKDYSILGSILGPLILGKYHIQLSSAISKEAPHLQNPEALHLKDVRPLV